MNELQLSINVPSEVKIDRVLHENGEKKCLPVELKDKKNKITYSNSVFLFKNNISITWSL